MVHFFSQRCIPRVKCLAVALRFRGAFTIVGVKGLRGLGVKSLRV